MSGPVRQTERHVDAVLAALDLLECFLNAPEMTTRDLVEATGFTRNRVLRMAGTLAHRGYLVENGAGSYRTGPKVFALSRVFERAGGVLSLVRPVLREIALQTGESASLYVREGLERVVTAREEGTHSIRHSVAEGQRMDLHAGAAGKVILAHSPQEVVAAFFRKGSLPARTTRTITSRRRLSAELARVRRQGYAVSVGERAADACAVAAPVFSRGRELVGALTVSGPITRFDPETRSRYAELLVTAARRVSSQLGGS